MTTNAYITALVTWAYNLPGTDGDATARRARLLQFAQEVADDVWFYREWPFVYKRGSVTTDSTGEVAMPSDFSEVGRDGGIYNSSNVRLEYRDPYVLEELAQNSITNSSSMIYTLIGQDSTTPFQVKLKTLLPSQSVDVVYRKHPPTLLDVTTAATNGLTQFPIEFHNKVFTPGGKWKIYQSIDDARKVEFAQEYEAGKADMAKRLRPGKDTLRRLPSALPFGQW